MAEQGAGNDANTRGHDDTNKISGESEAITSTTAATSGGGGGSTTPEDDADERSELPAGDDSGGPSLQAPTAGEPQHSRLADG